MIRRALAASLVILIAGCEADAKRQAVAPPEATAAARLAIDPAKPVGPVNRLVFGHNIEAGNGKDIFGSKTDTNDPRAGRGAWDVAARAPIADTVAWSKAIGMGMLRYPGGCLTHNFDWKRAVGPLAERPYYTFGIDEYLAFCRTVGAAPLMNVSELADPADAAALVEYLNAPADAAHPWAQKRATWGHPEPWKVTWFEMANESDHGNHDVKPSIRRTAGEYADWVLACAATMRAMDPSIRIGAHVGTGTPVADPWNATVLSRVKTGVDFVAVHTYAVGSPSENAPPELVGRACMAATEQVGALLADYRALIRRCTGADIPLAVTEYNAGFVQEKPLPWRFSYAAALHSADQLRLMLEPQANVVMANYWQFINGYWGFLRGDEVPKGDVRWKTTAAAPVFRLWGEHVGTTLVEQSVSGVPRLDFEGFQRVQPATGDAWIEPRVLGTRPLAFTAHDAGGLAVSPAGEGAATIVCTGLKANAYHNLPAFPAKPGQVYRLTWEQRSEGASAAGFAPGMGLCDARGWNATRSACGSHSGTPLGDGWSAYTTEMSTLPDATGLTGVIRLEGVPAALDARISIRKATITELSPRTAPAFAPITSHASLSADGKVLHVVVFNKHHDQPTTLSVAIADGSARSARAWCVTGPFEGTNIPTETVRETLGGSLVPGVTGNGFTWTFPPRSMTAFDIAR